MHRVPFDAMRGPLGLWLCLLLLLYQTTTCQSFVEHLQLQSNGKRGLVVPLSIRHGVHRVRGRSLLRSGMTPVLGAIREGYFYAQLGLGTPPRNFSTIIDTGSTITYIPCSNCRHCGEHMDPGFDPAQSSTATVLGCQHKLCNCGVPTCSCLQNKCYYSRRYAEMSSSEGWLVSDKLAFPDNGSSIDFVFGCEDKETGAIYKQRVDGVLGMGNNDNSFPRQLARSGLVDDVFSLCYGFPAGGMMLLGDVPLDPSPKLQYTPLIDRRLHYYNIDLQSISLDGKSLAVSKADYARGYGAVLDSGTTFTYLPTAAFKAFVALLNTAVKGKALRKTSGADPQYNDICWRGAPHDFKDIEEFFPNGTITFGGGASFQLTPQRYLFMVGHGEYCLGVFDNGWQGTLIGGIIVRNVLVQYDKKNSRVGFAEADCNQIRSAPAATGPPSAAPSSPSSFAAPQSAAATGEGAQDRAQGAPAPAAGTVKQSEAQQQPDSQDRSVEFDSESVEPDREQEQSMAEDDEQQPEQQEQQPAEQQQQQQQQVEVQQQQQQPEEQQQIRQQQQQPSPLTMGSGISAGAGNTQGLAASTQQDWWLGFASGGVLVALVIAVVQMARSSSTKRGNALNLPVSTGRTSYRQVQESDPDVETELAPFNGRAGGAAGSSTGSTVPG